MIKESEIDGLSASLNELRIAQLLACHQAELSVKSNTYAFSKSDPTNLNEAV